MVKSTNDSSAKYGVCERCENWASTIYHVWGWREDRRYSSLFLCESCKDKEAPLVVDELPPRD
jgi:hypothetical protein